MWFFHFQKFTLLSSDCLTHVCSVILKRIFKCLFLIIFWNKWSFEKPLDLHIDQLHDYSNHFAIISPQKGHYPSPLQGYFLLIFIEINPIVIEKILKSHMSFFSVFRCDLLRKMSWPLIWTNLICLCPKMLFTKFSWFWINGRWKYEKKFNGYKNINSTHIYIRKVRSCIRLCKLRLDNMTTIKMS